MLILVQYSLGYLFIGLKQAVLNFAAKQAICADPKWQFPVCAMVLSDLSEAAPLTL